MDHAAVLEIFLELEEQYGILQVTPDDTHRVILGRHLVADVVIARHAPAGHDAAQIQRATDLTSRLIELLADADAAQRRVGEYFGAVERARIRRMGAEGAAPGDFLPGVVSPPLTPLDDERAGGADHTLTQTGNHLSLRKYLDLAFELLGTPSADLRVDAVLNLDDLRQVLERRVADREACTRDDSIEHRGHYYAFESIS